MLFAGAAGGGVGDRARGALHVRRHASRGPAAILHRHFLPLPGYPIEKRTGGVCGRRGPRAGTASPDPDAVRAALAAMEAAMDSAAPADAALEL